VATVDFDVLAEPPRLDQGLKEANRSSTRRLSVVVAKAEAEPETSLWKICAEAASPRFSVLEWIVFLLFGALSLGALAYCFSESLHLFNSGALDDIVRAFLTV
jgi:hypothetical protein